MEAIIYLFLLFLLFLAIYVLAVYIIPAVAAVIGIVAIFVGFVSAISNYFSAIQQEMNLLHWTWEKDSEPARRSYFFGPGYAQLKNTISKAFEFNAESGEEVSKTAAGFKGNKGWWGICKSIGAYLYQAIAYICIYIIGMILCAVLGLVHGTITTAIMIPTYIIFTIVWLIDRIYLLKNKIRSDCPICHTPFLIPHFMCSECGAMHKKLVPGPYGIWKHKCSCGHKLPSTFLNGRSNLEAFCPNCASPLVAANAHPIVFQLIGGSKSGKTVFLSAFFHEYLLALKSKGNLEITITEQYQPFFDELEQWYSGIDCPSTAQFNSQMYPLLVDSDLGIRRQFSIYDIAGEMFDGFTADSEIQQQQFHYCDGLLFLLDPFSSGTLRSNRLASGEDVSDFSDMAVEDVVTNFINYLIKTGHAKVNSRCNIPISVIIAKADIKEVNRCIGPAQINNVFKNNPDKYKTLEQARDGECRQFLIDIGLSAAVENLEAQFLNLNYFPVSAMGHTPDSSEYEPWGVVDSVAWMLPLADKDFAALIIPPQVAAV